MCSNVMHKIVMYIIVHFRSQEESQADYFDEDCQEGLLNEVRKDISRDPSADQTAELREGEHHKNSYRTSKPPLKPSQS